MMPNDHIRFTHDKASGDLVLIWNGVGTGGTEQKIALEEDTDTGSNFDYRSVNPVLVNGHPHVLKVGKNDPASSGVAGEIVFFIEDVSPTGGSHPGHAGADR
jgi:hypothetical protein